MTLDEINEFLEDVRNRQSCDGDEANLNAALVDIKKEAVRVGDESRAKLVWRYEQVLNIQCSYLKAFYQLKDKDFYAGWCTLEKVENRIKGLSRHAEIGDQFALGTIYDHTQRFQRLFPYKYFMSPGILIIDSHCSICEAPRKLRNSCGHKIGEIYGGEVCCQVVTKADLLEMSLVTKPVQKYSVPFTRDEETGEQVDHYDYSLVEYVASCISGPFSDWNVKWSTKRHPHSHFSEVRPEDSCPCESEQSYQNCCLKKSGVLRPHLDLILYESPPPSVPLIAYSRKAQGKPST